MSIDVGYPEYMKICSKCSEKPENENDIFCGICGGRIVNSDIRKPTSETGC